MKKLQNYLMKPEELRKKLENPRFRQDFVDWTKNNISIQKENVSKQSRSRSPVERIQHSLQLNHKKNPTINKENSKTQTALKQSAPSKSIQRTPLGIKSSYDQLNKHSNIKRNASNAFSKFADVKTSHHQSLTSKQRYNSCGSIEQKRERSVSHMASVEEKKVKQKYSYRTRQGVQITNPNKVNQDSLVIKTNLANKGINLYAVADGHGTFGHLVSQYLVKNVSKMLDNELKDFGIQEAVPKVFQNLQKGLTESDINVSCSGSTFAGVFIDSD